MMIRLFSLTFLLVSLLTTQVFGGGLNSGLNRKKVRVVQNSGARGQQRPQTSASQIIEVDQEDTSSANSRTKAQQSAIDSFLRSAKSTGASTLRHTPKTQRSQPSTRRAQPVVGDSLIDDDELARAMEIDEEDQEDQEDTSSGSLFKMLGKAGLVAGLLFLGYKLYDMINSGSAVASALTAPLPGAATPAATPASTTAPSAATGSPSTTTTATTSASTTSASTTTALPLPTTPPATTLEAAQHTVVHAHNAAVNADAGITEARAMMTRVEGKLNQTTTQVSALTTQMLTLFNRFANGPLGAMAGLDDRSRILQIIADNSAASQSQNILELDADDDKTIKSCRMTGRAASKILKALKQEFSLDYDRPGKFSQSTLSINKLIKMCIKDKNKAARVKNLQMTDGEQRVHDIIVRNVSPEVATAIRSNYAGERKKTLRQLGVTDDQAQQILRDINGRGSSFEYNRQTRDTFLNTALKDAIKIWGAPDSDSDSSSSSSSSDDSDSDDSDDSSSDDSGESTNSDSTESDSDDSDDSQTDDSDSE